MNSRISLEKQQEGENEMEVRRVNLMAGKNAQGGQVMWIGERWASLAGEEQALSRGGTLVVPWGTNLKPRMRCKPSRQPRLLSLEIHCLVYYTLWSPKPSCITWTSDGFSRCRQAQLEWARFDHANAKDQQYWGPGGSQGIWVLCPLVFYTLQVQCHCVLHGWQTWRVALAAQLRNASLSNSENSVQKVCGP
jgi:hypothetical protein